MHENQDDQHDLEALRQHVPVLLAVLAELPARPSEAAEDMRELHVMLKATRWRREAVRQLARIASFVVSSGGVVAAILYLWERFRSPPH